MKPVLLVLLVALPAGLALAGCGQKANLYLPGHNPNPPERLIQPAGQDHKSAGSNDDNHASGDSGKASRPGTVESDDGGG